MEITPNARGFASGTFTDRYGERCRLSKSSLAGEDAIWLGVVEITPKIMASDARRLGIETDQTTGWIDYPIPKEVMLGGSMHLTREMVADLLPALQHFVETGELPVQPVAPETED